MPTAGIKFQIEDQTTGQFAFLAYTHPQLYDFRYLSEGREEVYNLGNGKPYVAIHLWPGDNRIANTVVWPMVADFETKRAGNLAGGKVEDTLQRETRSRGGGWEGGFGSFSRMNVTLTWMYS